MVALHPMVQMGTIIAIYWSNFALFSADVIFLIYLYQRWVYPVDKKRVNEFGFGGEDEGQSSEAIEATKEGQSSEAIEATKEEKKTKWSLF